MAGGQNHELLVRGTCIELFLTIGKRRAMQIYICARMLLLQYTVGQLGKFMINCSSSDDLSQHTPQALHRANHKAEAAATPGVARCHGPRRPYTARAPQEEQADSDAEHITYPSIQIK
jgi:hypothetical protein